MAMYNAICLQADTMWAHRHSSQLLQLVSKSPGPRISVMIIYKTSMPKWIGPESHQAVHSEDLALQESSLNCAALYNSTQDGHIYSCRLAQSKWCCMQGSCFCSPMHLHKASWYVAHCMKSGCPSHAHQYKMSSVQQNEQ